MRSPPDAHSGDQDGEDGDHQRLGSEELKLTLNRSIEDRRREAGVPTAVYRNEGGNGQQSCTGKCERSNQTHASQSNERGGRSCPS